MKTVNVQKIISELTTIKEETLDPCTRSELEEVLVGLRCYLSGESDYYEIWVHSKNELSEIQLLKLTQAFGLIRSKKPQGNAFSCHDLDCDWEDMCRKGYATKKMEGTIIVYSGTIHALRLIYRNDITTSYFLNLANQ